MQLLIPVIARDITNLSDARFFASYGVDWLCFTCNPEAKTYINSEKIKEIMNWVSGPQLMLNCIGCTDELRSDLMEHLQPEALLVEDYIDYPNYDEVLQFQTEPIISTSTDESLLRSELNARPNEVNIFNFRINSVPFDCQLLPESIETMPSYVDAELTIQELQQLIDLRSNYGIVVYGGHEAEVGMKAFDDVQVVMEFLVED